MKRSTNYLYVAVALGLATAVLSFCRSGRLRDLGMLLVLAAALWFAASTMVFRFRHPHATETQILFHLKDALLFREVPRSQFDR